MSSSSNAVAASSSSSSSSTSSSSSSSNSSGWLGWGLGIGVAASALAWVAYQYREYSKKEAQRAEKRRERDAKRAAKATVAAGSPPGGITVDEEEENKRKERVKEKKAKKEKDRKDKEAKAAALAELPSDSTMNNRCKRWIDDAPQLGPTILERSKSLLGDIRKIYKVNGGIKSSDGYSDETRWMIAQVLSTYHALQAMLLTPQGGLMGLGLQKTPEEIAEWQKEHLADMQIAFSAAEGIIYDPHDPTKKTATMRLDMAQRMKSSKHMLAVFHEMIADAHELKEEELMAAFMVAPLLGKFDATKLLAPKVVDLQSWEAFHNLALEQAGIPDYSVLFELANKQTEDAKIDDLKWFGLELVSVSTKMSKFEASDPKTAAPSESERESRTQKLERGQHPLQLMGVCARMQAPSPIPLPLTGLAMKDSLYLTGHADIEAKDRIASHRETYDLKLVEHKEAAEGQREKFIYRGTFRLEQGPPTTKAEKKTTDTLMVEFDTTLEFERSDHD